MSPVHPNYRWWTVRVWRDDTGYGGKLGPITVWLNAYKGSHWLFVGVLGRWALYDSILWELQKEAEAFQSAQTIAGLESTTAPNVSTKGHPIR